MKTTMTDVKELLKDLFLPAMTAFQLGKFYTGLALILFVAGLNYDLEAVLILAGVCLGAAMIAFFASLGD